MQDDTLLFYLVALIVLILIVVAILVWAVVSFVKKGKSQTAENPVTDRNEIKVPPPAAAGPATGKSKEIMRILRDLTDGTLYIEVEGRVYRQLTDIRSPEIGRLVLQTVAELLRFTKGVTPAVQPGAQATPQKPMPVSLLQPQDKTPLPPSKPVGSLAQRGEALIKPAPAPKSEPGAETPSSARLLQRVYKLSETPAATEQAAAPPSTPQEPRHLPLIVPEAKSKVDLKSFWERAITPSTPSAGVTGPRPLADELEDVLKDFIRTLPEPPAREIHFRTAPDGRMVIDVNNVSYQDVEDVKDPIVKEIIQAVVKKWERL